MIAASSLSGAGAAPGPNGLVAYSAWDEESNYDIYLIDPANPSAPPVRLTTDGHYNANPDWSPDGRKIAYDGWGDTLGPRIRVMDIDPTTDDSTILSEACADALECYGDFQPAWSPDGTRIAFVSSRPSADGSPGWGYQLYVMDALGEVGELSNATRLTTDIPDEETGKMIGNSQVTWSPDGNRIAFVSTGRGENEDACDLWVMQPRDLDGDGFGDNLQRLTFDESFNCDAFEDMTPQWSPNSSLIAFTSVRSGYFDIWLVNADDPEDLRNVTQTPEDYEDQPSWSPDGTQIIFRKPIDGAYEFFSLPVSPPAQGIGKAAVRGKPHPKQITFDGANKQQFDWGARAGKRATHTLTVLRSGPGRVDSVSDGIACGKDCTATYASGEKVKLKVIPRKGYIFKGWIGACAAFSSESCLVTMNKSRRVKASFGK